MVFTLTNGKLIDTGMMAMAMEDADSADQYYLNMQTGEVSFFLEFAFSSEERERLSEEFEGDEYIPIERIPSHEAYQWMEDFAKQFVAPKDKHIAKKLSIALMGKGAFRRFKNVLNSLGEEWIQVWYSWKDKHLYEAMKQWIASLPGPIIEQ